jgi:tetratricopeptide (TPR) repeat protein
MNIHQLLNLGSDYSARARFAEAERCFREGLAADPGNAHALNGLGVALHEQGKLDEARQALAAALQQAPDLGDAHFNLGRLHLELGELDPALACFEEVLRRDPADADSFAAIATALERRGEFAEAEEYFAEAAQFSNRYLVTKMLRFSAGFLREIDAAVRQDALPDAALRSDPGGDREAVALASCDMEYLRRYGPPFANSLARYAPGGILLHLHVLDPDAPIEAAATLLRQAGVERYCVTVERGDRHAAGSHARAVWYTCARLLHLEKWLRAYAAPIVMLDVDVAIQAPLTRLIEATGAADLGLFLRRPRRAPWLDVVANTLVARPTAAALDYARLAGNYADYFLRRDDPRWHLDQCALYCTLRMLQARGSPLVAREITDAVFDTVYHVGHGHDERMADPRYARFVPSGQGTSA